MASKFFTTNENKTEGEKKMTQDQNKRDTSSIAISTGSGNKLRMGKRSHASVAISNPP